MKRSGKQSMRASQTMPQLNYTKEDIQEQYLISSKVRNQDHKSSESGRNPPTSNNKVASHSSAKKKCRLDRNNNNSSQDDQNFCDDYNQENRNQKNNSLDWERSQDSTDDRKAQPEASTRASRSATRDTPDSKGERQGRRSRSASFFSGCFIIPYSIGSMLSSSNANSKDSGGKRSILAHLGIGSSSSTSQRQRRPISNSQTSGNLNQVALDSDGAFNSFGRQQQQSSRKHVSFEGQRSSLGTDLSGAGQTVAGNSSQQEPTTTGKQTSSTNSNNVITRNYHPNNPPLKQTQMTTIGNNMSNRQQVTVNSTVARESMGRSDALATIENTPMRITNNQQREHIYRNQPPAIRNQPPTINSRMPSQTAKREYQVGDYSPSCKSRVANLDNDESRPSPRGHFIDLSGGGCHTHQATRNSRGLGTTTLYKQLPAVLMRTQATQTEITSYHLMAATPTSSNSSAPTTRWMSGSSNANAVRELNSSHELDIHTTDSTPRQLPLQGDGLAKTVGRSDGGDKPAPSSEHEHRREQDDEEDEIEECGNLNASLLASSCSSSSVASLEGHDSALAMTLQCDLRVSTEDDSLERDPKARASIISDGNKRLACQELAENAAAKTTDRSESQHEDADLGTRIELKLKTDKRKSRPTTNDSDASMSTNATSELEPPSNFKDESIDREKLELIEPKLEGYRQVEFGSTTELIENESNPDEQVHLQKEKLHQQYGDSTKSTSLTDETSDSNLETADDLPQFGRITSAADNLSQVTSGDSTEGQAESRENFNISYEVLNDQPSPVRVPSPPSISEASSQTDSSMVAHIIAIGRSLDEASLGRKGSVTPTNESLALESRNDPSGISFDTTVCPGQLMDLADDIASLSGPAHKGCLDNHNKVMNFDATIETNDDDINANETTSQRDQKKSESERKYPDLGAFQRRDDFLDLDEQLSRGSATGSKQIIDPQDQELTALESVDDNEDMSLDILASGMNQSNFSQNIKRSSTSTLSTRHHSYCSSEEFTRDFPLGKQKSADLTGEQNVDFAPRRELNSGIANRPSDLSEIEEISPSAEKKLIGYAMTSSSSGQEPLPADEELLEFGSLPEASSGDGNTKDKANQELVDKLVDPQTTPELLPQMTGQSQMSVPFLQSLVSTTISPDCDSGADHGKEQSRDCKICDLGDSRIQLASGLELESFEQPESRGLERGEETQSLDQKAAYSLASVAVGEPSSDDLNGATSGRIESTSRVVVEAQKSLDASAPLQSCNSRVRISERSLQLSSSFSASSSSSSSSEAKSSAQSKGSKSGTDERLVLSNVDSNSLSEPSTGNSDLEATGSKSKVSGGFYQPVRQLSTSPPTTVSELDQDEELSTPSFVDTYRGRIAQVRDFAESVLDDLLDECLIAQANPQLSALNSNANSETQATCCVPQDTTNDQPYDRILMRIDGLEVDRRQSPADKNLGAEALGGLDVEDSESSSGSSTKRTSSSSTSISANSYLCCHPEKEPLGGFQEHSTKRPAVKGQKPKLPDKPAHLRSASTPMKQEKPSERVSIEQKGHGAAAAAVAVTATSIAGAVHALQSERPATSESCQWASSSLENSNRQVTVDDQDTRRTLKGSQHKQNADLLGEEIANLDSGQVGEGDSCDVAKEAEDFNPDKRVAAQDSARHPSLYSSQSQDFGRNSSEGPALVSRSSSVCSASSVVAASVVRPPGQTPDTQAIRAEHQANPSDDLSSSSLPTQQEPRSSLDDTSKGSTVTSISQLATRGSSSEEASKSTERSGEVDHEGVTSLELIESAENEQVPESHVDSLEVALRQSSREDLSTVSEVSEDVSATPSAPKTKGRQRAFLDSSTDQTKPSSFEWNENVQVQANLGQQNDCCKSQLIQQPGNSEAPGITTTEQDLACADFTLRSQSSEAAALTMASELDQNNSLSSTHSMGVTQTPPSEQHQAHQVSRQLSGEQRRRSIGSSANSSIASTTPPPATHSSLSHPRPQGVRSPLDCPYVHEIFSLSPQAAESTPLRTSSPVQAVLLSAHHKRLSHDDTMEAIEDDVEGEEMELQSQNLPPLGDSPEPLDIAPPAAFNGSIASQPIREEPESMPLEDNDQSDPEECDEESSISVSQHGVIVTHETAGPETPTASKRKIASPSGSSGSYSPLLSSATLETPKKDKNNPEKTDPIDEFSSQHSATHAILEHLSIHHPDSVQLDEPAPALEQSRSLGTEGRRESWRSESSRFGTTIGQDLEESNARITPEAEHPGSVDSQCTSTGTMKRKPKLSDKLVPETNEDQKENFKVAELANRPNQRRGPPLSQLKNTNESKLIDQSSALTRTSNSMSIEQNPQISGSLATDTSICSSCSCQETSIDFTQNELHQAQDQTPNTSHTHKSTWMSQEEGTVFTENYWLAHWLYISEHEESEIWRQAIDMKASTSSAQTDKPNEAEDEESQAEWPSVAGMPKDMSEISSTTSEKNFSLRYKATTRKMIHRRASIEMFKRILNNTLRREKRVEISRSNGEFGFRIHGSRPVVVSAIEKGTSAETCGLQVGDLIYAINGTNILDMAHSDVVRLAHNADSSVLVLDLVPTNNFLRVGKYNRANNRRYEPTVTGFLMRLSSSTAQPLLIELQEQMSKTPSASSQHRAAKLAQVMRLAWRQRYFVLRNDNCLYWYKSPTDIEPYGGINLQGFSATLTNEFSEPNYVIRLIKYGGQPHYLGSNNMCDVQTWIDAINLAATEANQNDPYMKRTLMLARGKPSEIPEPDCCGYLYKFSHKRGGGAHWRAAYFVLKDACLYLFRDQQADSVNQASAVYYLHGYRVRSKHIENKKHTFELIPPNKRTIRPMFLMANNDIDKKRWIAALEYSIDRWIEID